MKTRGHYRNRAGHAWRSGVAGVATIVASTWLAAAVAAGATSTAATNGRTSGRTRPMLRSGSISPAVAAPTRGSRFPNEPAGMTAQINTGRIVRLDAATIASPTTKSATGEWSGNLQLVPDGTGLRVIYDPSLTAGTSPVRWSMGSFNTVGTGWLYMRLRVRFSSNFTTAANPACKFGEPDTGFHGSGAGSTENHIAPLWAPAVSSTQLVPAVGLQGPNSHPSILGTFPTGLQGGARNVISDNSWHVVEYLFGPESPAGAGNGLAKVWTDGTVAVNRSDINWRAAGQPNQWVGIFFDPVYGGTKSSPPVSMWLDFDELYVSSK